MVLLNQPELELDCHIALQFLRAELGLPGREAPLPEAQVEERISSRVQHGQGAPLGFVRPAHALSAADFPGLLDWLALLIQHDLTAPIAFWNRLPIRIRDWLSLIRPPGALVTCDEHALMSDFLVEVRA